MQEPELGSAEKGSWRQVSIKDRIVCGSGAFTVQNQIQPGAIVVFRNPNPDELDRDGKQVPMRVLEVNGDRVKVEAMVNLEFRPTNVHLVNELILENGG